MRVARCTTPLTTLLWVMATPLGAPVEPEVYITYARCCGRRVTARTPPTASAAGSAPVSGSSRKSTGTSQAGSTPTVSWSVRISCGAASVRMYSSR